MLLKRFNQYSKIISFTSILLCMNVSISGQSHEGHTHKQPQEAKTILPQPIKEAKEIKKGKIESTQKSEDIKNENSNPVESPSINDIPKDKEDKSNRVLPETSNHSHHHPGPLATPAGLMLPHIHTTKDWMVDYMYMQMDMRSLYNGSNIEDPNKFLAGIQYNPTISTIPSSQAATGSAHNHSGITTPSTAPDLFPSYYIASLNPNPYRYMSMPVSMKMEMTMISLMKNINDKMAIMFMLPYINNSMQMLSGNLEKSFMRTQGIGDIGVTLAYKFWDSKSHTVNLQFGVTLPTGSIDEKNQMPLMGKLKSPYNMQLGTGTYNTIPGISYIYNQGKFTLGGFGQITLRNGKNDNSYRFGNRYEFSVWTSYILLDWLAPTLRITSSKWDNISGSDTSLDPTMDPQNDPNRQGGRRIDLLGGLNFYFPAFSEKIKAGLELGKPIYQHLNGPQMGANTLFNFRLQGSF